MRLSQPLLALSLATSACPRLGIRNERHETDSGFMVHFMEYVQFHVHFMEGLRNGRSSIFISFKFSFMKPACRPVHSSFRIPTHATILVLTE
jgi:hypothetical protein